MMNLSYRKIREKHYESYESSTVMDEFGFDPNNWKANPYTFIKVRYYLELSSILVYLILRFTNIGPNIISMVSIICGLLVPILLSLDSIHFAICAVAIIFNKSLFDFSDGQIARIRKLTSIKGHLLDEYGGTANSIGMWLGLCLYFHHVGAEVLYLYLALIIITCLTLRIRLHSSQALIHLIKNNKLSCENKINKKISLIDIKKNDFRNYVPRARIVIAAFLDDRSRSVDFILLIFLIDLMVSTTFTVFLIYIYTLKSILFYFYDFYDFYFGDWVDPFESEN